MTEKTGGTRTGIESELEKLRKENDQLVEDLKALRIFEKPDSYWGWDRSWQEEIYRIIHRTKLEEK